MTLDVNVISLAAEILAWAIIAMIVYRIYKRKPVKLTVWKMIVVFFVGLGSFSIKWTINDTLISLSILPLGVWLLFLIKGRKERWQYYRSFAWFGFFANYIFLATNLITIPLKGIIYPEENLSSYISGVDHASVIKIHPSAINRSLNRENLIDQLPNMKKKAIFSEEWYRETVMNVESKNRSERFPFLLSGTTPRFGSGIHTVIYVERDGKGLLILTPQKQLYFRSKDTLLKGANP
ncbi:hypothetical protein RCG23_01315 [Neobacillus sp. PS3-34]|uniref:hypothetical protein n=1 Tax=Neobacillus sp. PS3-34 TaxID=3070678 RepID=UPI0027DFAC62|nr:hypothetical protein [Neobacillus sp. PS3-34]WML48802.1 hypothetical protein RCG23_01315 [Neobacillus sp. PS3-34]